MTRLDVDGVGYTNASQMLGDGNRFAAVAVDTLGATLADGGAMAGDSSFASEFAAAYDEGAAAAVGAFDDVVDAFASLCRISYCSLENHYRAEESSIASTIVVSSQPSLLSTSLYAGASPAPPPSLGGDSSHVPDWANMILDHVEGFVWPDADVDRLRSTAGAWRTAAGEVDHLVDLCGDAVGELYEERSPEIYLATGAIAELQQGLRQLAAACGQLAVACDDYADSVEKQRELILDLVRDLIRDAVIIQAAGFVLGLVTGGSTNAVAAWINSGKLASQVPKLKALVDAVRVVGAGAAGAVRSSTGAVVRARVTFAKFTKARRLQFTDRGAISLGKDVTWLRSHEGGWAKAHTLRKHVGKTDEFLRMRLRDEPNRHKVSTFTDEATAERSIRSVLTQHGDAVRSWLASPTQAGKPLSSVMPYDVGRIMDRAGDVQVGRGVRVVLVKDRGMPDGYRILTAMVQ